MSFVFPRHDLDRPAQLLDLLGSFWSEVYPQRAFVQAAAGALGELFGQAFRDLEDAARTLARPTVPIWHQEDWTELVLVASERLPNPLRYGDGALYDGSHTYGEARTGPVSYPLGTIRDVDLISNRLADPSVVLCKGIDFTIGPGAITFASDPLKNPLFVPRATVDSSGQEIDSEAVLWLWRARTDLHQIADYFGYILGMAGPSSPNFKELIVALLDSLSGGSAYAHLARVLAAVTDIPLARSQETVVDLIQAPDQVLVITDQNAYRYVPGTIPQVAIGQQVPPFAALSDGLLIDELRLGSIPEGLDALVTGRGLLSPVYAAELVWENRLVPLVVETVSGRTKVSWQLGGDPAAVSQFWADVHARGIAQGKTLAQCLDIRPNPVGDPTAASLPGTINPLAFLLANLLRGGAVLVRLNLDRLGPEALPLGQLRQLRRVVPPTVALLFAATLPALADSITMAGALDTLGGSVGQDPLADALSRGTDALVMYH